MNTENKIQAAQIYRNAVAYHRNMIRFLMQLYRENHLAVNFKLAKEHAEEIKKLMRDWQISYPSDRR